MKVCVYGCGAIGSLLAARLSGAGADVSVVARGAQLEALQSCGITVVNPSGVTEPAVTVAATSVAAELGPQDLVIVTLKSHSLAAAAADITSLLGRDTAIVTAGNGLPWWYFYAVPGFASDTPQVGGRLTSVDPAGEIWNALGPQRAIGAVIYPAAQLLKPGTVQHLFGDRLTLGEPNGRTTERIQKVAGLLNAAGFDAPVQAEIRGELWTKLMANAAYNPVSVLTGKTLGSMLDDTEVVASLTKIMHEVTAVAHAIHVAIPVAPQHML